MNADKRRFETKIRILRVNPRPIKLIEKSHE